MEQQEEDAKDNVQDDDMSPAEQPDQPWTVPSTGKFYMHDDRSKGNGRRRGRGKNRSRGRGRNNRSSKNDESRENGSGRRSPDKQGRQRTLWQEETEEDPQWQHDKYNEVDRDSGRRGRRGRGGFKNRGRGKGYRQRGGKRGRYSEKRTVYRKKKQDDKQGDRASGKTTLKYRPKGTNDNNTKHEQHNGSRRHGKHKQRGNQHEENNHSQLQWADAKNGDGDYLNGMDELDLSGLPAKPKRYSTQRAVRSTQELQQWMAQGHGDPVAYNQGVGSGAGNVPMMLSQSGVPIMMPQGQMPPGYPAAYPTMPVVWSQDGTVAGGVNPNMMNGMPQGQAVQQYFYLPNVTAAQYGQPNPPYRYSQPYMDHKGQVYYPLATQPAPGTSTQAEGAADRPSESGKRKMSADVAEFVPYHLRMGAAMPATPAVQTPPAQNSNEQPAPQPKPAKSKSYKSSNGRSRNNRSSRPQQQWVPKKRAPAAAAPSPAESTPPTASKTSDSAIESANAATGGEAESGHAPDAKIVET